MIFENVKKVIIDIAGVSEEEVLIESNLFDELDVDSLDMSQIVLALENVYKITIPDSELEHFVTVNDIVKNIEKQIEG